MARIRSVKPEFWHDPGMRRLSRDARLLYIGLWNLADEHGRLIGEPEYVKGQLFPYDAIDVLPLLDELVNSGRAVRYAVADSTYLYLPKLAQHQRLDDKVASKLPAPEQGEQTTPDHGADSSGEVQINPEESSLLYVAGSMEHVAGSMSTGEAEPRRGDVEEVCARLADRMVANGCVRPPITRKWRDSARLILDRDQRPLPEVLALIDWTQRSDFWAPNIHSLPKFREKYDTLRQQARRGSSSQPQPYRNPTDESVYDQPLEAS